MIASTHRMFLQAALCILAIGCMVSLFVSRNDLQNDNRRRLRQEYSESSQQLLDLSSDNDPNTAQPQPDANVPNAVVAAKDPADDLVQSDAEDVSSFWWKDIDYNLPWQCGRYKCYFQSMSNSGKGFLSFDDRVHRVAKPRQHIDMPKSWKPNTTLPSFSRVLPLKQLFQTILQVKLPATMSSTIDLMELTLWLCSQAAAHRSIQFFSSVRGSRSITY